MQWITKTEDRNRIYLDYVNAGMRMDIKNHSIGTLCAWVNIKEAFNLGDKINKEVRFSFGRPTADYKERWCLKEPLFRVLY